MGVEQIANRTSGLGEVQSSQVRRLVTSMRSLSSDYHTGVTVVTWPTECGPVDSAMEHAVTVQGGPKIVKQSLEMILLDGRHCRSAVRTRKAECKNGEMNELSIHCTSSKSSDGTIRPLDRSEDRGSANDEHVHGDWAHVPLVFVHGEGHLE